MLCRLDPVSENGEQMETIGMYLWEPLSKWHAQGRADGPIGDSSVGRAVTTSKPQHACCDQHSCYR
jgi:hypothetical protein